MTKDLNRVVHALNCGKRETQGTLSTDGKTIYSYMFPIMRRADDGGLSIIHRYPSKTTQRAINDLAREFPNASRTEAL
jgi:hypothetical protein